jgi:flagellar protein FlbD
MIRLTRINQVPLVLNADLIEHLETTPDTVISMTNGQKFVVLESSDDVIRKVIEFRREILRSGPPQALDTCR